MYTKHRVNIPENLTLLGIEIKGITIRHTKNEDGHYGILYLKFTKKRRRIVYHDSDLLEELSDFLLQRGLRFKELYWTEKGMQSLSYSTFDIEF